jgi:hypothetical protein
MLPTTAYFPIFLSSRLAIRFGGIFAVTAFTVFPLLSWHSFGLGRDVPPKRRLT